MLKVLSLMKRKEGMSYAEFRNWALNEHPHARAKLPGLQRLPHERAPRGEPGLALRRDQRDVVRQRRGARRRASATDAGKAAGGDAAAHCASRFHFVAEEKDVHLSNRFSSPEAARRQRCAGPTISPMRGLPSPPFWRLSSASRLLVEGVPGVGKTEAAKALAQGARPRSHPPAVL